RGIRVLQYGHDLIRRMTAAGSELRVALGAVDPIAERIGLVDVDESVESLVHPRRAPLIEPHDHGKPGVADLVRGDPEERLALVRDAIEQQPRILHPGAAAATLMAAG